MGQQINQNQVVKHIVFATINAKNQAAALYEQLTSFADSLTDEAVWSIIDELHAAGNMEIIRAVLMSAAQTPEAACTMLKVFKFNPDFMGLAIQAYDKNMRFQVKLLSMLDEYNPMLARNVLHQLKACQSYS